MDFGWWGGRDVTAAVSYTTRQPGEIGVLGLSMGGEQAIAALGSDRGMDRLPERGSAPDRRGGRSGTTGLPAGRAGRPALPRAAKRITESKLKTLRTRR
jgi:hypothetical protein